MPVKNAMQQALDASSALPPRSGIIQCMSNVQQYADFYSQVCEYVASHPHIRIGQAYFNMLEDINPRIANGLRGTDLDPFYSESVSEDTHTYVQYNWS